MTSPSPPPTLLCHILDTGYCLASEHHLQQGGRRQMVRVHSLVGLLHHPIQGWLLWDTGYAPRIAEASHHWPYWIYKALTPLRLQPELAVVRQLPRYGLTSNDIGHVVLSHFHADHVAGLRDFPTARWVATRDAYADAAPRRGVRAVRRAFLPDLIPENFPRHALWLDEFRGPPLPALGPTHDLFGDGSAVLVRLPGHARGQMGLLAHTDRGPILFAADGAMTSAAIRELRPPAPVTHPFVDDVPAMLDTLNRLNIFARMNPAVRLAPTHCPEVLERDVHPYPIRPPTEAEV